MADFYAAVDTAQRSSQKHAATGRFLDAEHCRQFARLSTELHVPLHLIPPAGHREKEAQRGDARIVNRRRDLGIRHVKLVGAKLLRRSRIRRSPQKPSGILHRSDGRLLSVD